MIITEWKTKYKSVKGNDINVATLGSGERTILIIGCMHGDEVQGKFVALKLLSYYEENPLALTDKKLIIVPVLNPDGYENNNRCNSNGVDLNRNYPSKNWELSKDKNEFYSGNKPASEPETQLIINLIETNKISLIINLHQPYKVINFDGPAEEYAELLSRYNHYEVVKDIGYSTPGSLGTYAGIEKNIPIITLELPENESDIRVWRDNHLALIGLINSI